MLTEGEVIEIGDWGQAIGERDGETKELLGESSNKWYKSMDCEGLELKNRYGFRKLKL